MDTKNIFANIPKNIKNEVFEEIIKTEHFRIERIISHNHATNQDYWYDQDQDEWVMLLKGSAGLLFEDNETVVVMSPGDYVKIAAHQKHRVEWTDPEAETVWLAIHY